MEIAGSYKVVMRCYDHLPDVFVATNSGVCFLVGTQNDNLLSFLLLKLYQQCPLIASPLCICPQTESMNWYAAVAETCWPSLSPLAEMRPRASSWLTLDCWSQAKMNWTRKRNRKLDIKGGIIQCTDICRTSDEEPIWTRMKFISWSSLYHNYFLNFLLHILNVAKYNLLLLKYYLKFFLFLLDF